MTTSDAGSPPGGSGTDGAAVGAGVTVVILAIIAAVVAAIVIIILIRRYKRGDKQGSKLYFSIFDVWMRNYVLIMYKQSNTFNSLCATFTDGFLRSIVCIPPCGYYKCPALQLCIYSCFP